VDEEEATEDGKGHISSIVIFLDQCRGRGYYRGWEGPRQ
jgi:hypothetical protein